MPTIKLTCNFMINIYYSDCLRDYGRFWWGLLSQCTRAHANRKSNPEAVRLEYIVTTDPDRLALITIITWHFKFHLLNISILHLKYEYGAQSESRFACYSHCYVTWNCRLTTPVIKGCCIRDALPHTSSFGVFKSVKKKSSPTKHIHNKSSNWIEDCTVVFDTSDCWNSP